LAFGWQAHILAERAATSLAVFPRTTHLALGFLAANITRSLSELFTTKFASRLFALRLANRGASGSIAVPFAVREAVSLHPCRGLHLLKPSSIRKRDILSRCVSHQDNAHQENRLHCPIFSGSKGSRGPLSFPGAQLQSAKLARTVSSSFGYAAMQRSRFKEDSSV